MRNGILTVLCCDCCPHEAYRDVLRRQKLEVTFIRHLTNMARVGLMDADGVFATLMELRTSDSEPAGLDPPMRFAEVPPPQAASDGGATAVDSRLR